MKNKKRKQTLTLLEIMIVIVLIGLIGSVIGFNMKGSLDEGKAFKSRQAKEQIRDILMLEVAQGANIEDVVNSKESYLENSGLVKNPKAYLKDGWGEPFVVRVGGRSHDTIVVESAKLKAYELKKRTKLGKSAPQADEDENDADE